MTHSTLADLRRLYHHLSNGGEFNLRVDTERIARAIRTIEELQDGACRFNCTTAKRQFARGCEWASGILPDDWEEAFDEFNAREKWKTSSSK
jgi:hypothetical protein